ncbi:terpene synthase family protein [Kibdelosporangium aridum]|uniref:terpene synthase family protein n=1 Tax=Kibdelosporangium aridum TaxID=2030 RepID=UPI0035E558DC
MRKFGIGGAGKIDRIVATQAAKWCSRIAPRASADGIQLIADWTYLGFLFDDVYLDEGPANTTPAAAAAIIGEVMHALESPDGETSDNPYVAAFRDLSRRAIAVADPVAVARWASGHLDWFLGALVCMNYRSSGRAAFTLEDALNYAARDAGLKVCLALVEMAEGLVLPARYLAMPSIRALTQAACFIVTCDAAICSYQREVVQGAEQVNIVSVLRHHFACSTQDALLEAVALRDQITWLFAEGAEREAGGPLLDAYVEMLGRFVGGNLEWCLSTTRYHGELATYESVPAAGLRGDKPAVGVLQPWHLPQIRWWWDALAIR